MRNDVGIVILGLKDLDEVRHDLLRSANSNFSTLHNLDLDTEDTLAKLDVTDGDINEILLGLTSRDLVASVVLLSLCTLATNLTRDDHFTASCTSATHDCTQDVVGSHTDGNTVEELVFKCLNIC